MSKGSTRITIRIGDDLLEEIKATVHRRNNAKNQKKHWDKTEYIIEAIVDKLNHDRRSRSDAERFRHSKPDDNMPREVWTE